MAAFGRIQNLKISSHAIQSQNTITSLAEVLPQNYDFIILFMFSLILYKYEIMPISSVMCRLNFVSD